MKFIKPDREIEQTVALVKDLRFGDFLLLLRKHIRHCDRAKHERISKIR